jgi:hypothetical protein
VRAAFTLLVLKLFGILFMLSARLALADARHSLPIQKGRIRAPTKGARRKRHAAEHISALRLLQRDEPVEKGNLRIRWPATSPQA